MEQVWDSEQLPTNTKESWRVVKWGETEASQQRPEGCARGWEGMLAVRRHQGVCWAGQPASSGPRSTGGARGQHRGTEEPGAEEAKCLGQTGRGDMLAGHADWASKLQTEAKTLGGGPQDTQP